MNISILGFEWERFPVPLRTLLQELETTPVPKDLSKQVLTVTQLDKDYWAGALVTPRDIQKFTQIIDQGGEIRVTAQTISNNGRLADINFFILNENTARGLYAHYWRSRGVHSFCEVVRRRYADLMERTKATELAEDGADEAAINSKYQYGMDYSQLVEPKKFQELIKKFAAVTELECVFSSYHYVEKEFEAIHGVADKVVQRFTFSRSADPVSLRDRIAKVAKKGRFAKAKVEGRNSSDEPMTLRLHNNILEFEAYDYDDLIGSLVVEYKDLAGSIKANNIVARMKSLLSAATIRAQLTSALSKK